MIKYFAVASSVLCIAGGVTLIVSSKGDCMQIGLGLYCLGKGLFVGPMLWVTKNKE